MVEQGNYITLITMSEVCKYISACKTPSTAGMKLEKQVRMKIGIIKYEPRSRWAWWPHRSHNFRYGRVGALARRVWD